jgi:outer membrane receptor protein involved in Fe transport
MKPNPKIAAAVAAILGAPATAVVFAAAETASATGTANELQEVIVTAERRTESVQDVPITIQALTSETLSQLNAKTFDDFVKYLPNVTAGGYGPGQSNVFIRGLATSIGGSQGVGATGSFPNVATYLDDQSGQVPGRNLDIYAADLERIEILEGPQGTLFGAGAQAGVVRYITNKPKLDRVEASVSAAYAVTAHGDPSTTVEGVLNVPVIPDKFAVRLVAYNDSRGGYINNIPGTFTRAATDQVVVNYFGGVVPPNSGSINNHSQIARAINPLTYQGVRGEFLYQFNDDWNLLLTQSYQNMDAEGVFWQEAYDGVYKVLPELSAHLYNPSYNKDKFTDTAWTLNGRLGSLQAVYTGAYLDRNITQQQDYTNYARGTYAGYYQCDYPGYPFVGGQPTSLNGVNTPGFCYTPSSFWTDHQRDTHISHEIRLSTPTDWRVRALVGGFYEKYLIYEGTDWFYGTSPHFYPIGPPSVDPKTGALFPVTVQNPNVRPLGDSFFDDIKRGYTQWAGFASVDFDIIPKTLTLTGGTRYYSMDTIERGTNVGSFGCEINGPYDSGTPAAPFVPPNPCVSTPTTGVLSNLNNLDAKRLEHTWSGAKSRANLTWHITPEVLSYVTFSQGFRPGGFNRAQAHITGPLAGVFVPPVSYAPDNLTNYELGWKTEWLDRHLQFNGAVYEEKWKDTQIEIFDPGVTGNLTFTTNGPDYRVRGLELQFIALPLQGLQISGAAAWNRSEVTRTVTFTGVNGQPVILNPNPFGDIGTPLAQSPPFSGNVRVRYSFPVADYLAFVQIGAVHQAHSYASTDRVTQELVTHAPVPVGCPTTPAPLNPACTTAYDDPAFTILDAAAGIGKGSWETQLFVQNLNDERAVTWSNYREFVKAESIAPPRTIGLRITYRFSEK